MKKDKRSKQPQTRRSSSANDERIAVENIFDSPATVTRPPYMYGKYEPASRQGPYE
jgi:hypothetical protein